MLDGIHILELFTLVKLVHFGVILLFKCDELGGSLVHQDLHLVADYFLLAG